MLFFLLENMTSIFHMFLVCCLTGVAPGIAVFLCATNIFIMHVFSVSVYPHWGRFDVCVVLTHTGGSAACLSYKNHVV